MSAILDNRLLPWMFGAVADPLHDAICMSLKSGNPLFNEKPYFHILVTPKGNREIFEKGTQAIRDLGYSFPMPMQPKLLLGILSLKSFPDLDKFPPSYANTVPYYRDHNFFWRNCFISSTRAQLYNWLHRSAKQAHKKFSEQDRGCYARMVLDRYQKDLIRLEDFYETKFVPPQEVENILSNLKILKRSFIPRTKPGKKAA